MRLAPLLVLLALLLGSACTVDRDPALVTCAEDAHCPSGWWCPGTPEEHATCTEGQRPADDDDAVGDDDVVDDDDDSKDDDDVSKDDDDSSSSDDDDASSPLDDDDSAAQDDDDATASDDDDAVDDDDLIDDDDDDSTPQDDDDVVDDDDATGSDDDDAVDDDDLIDDDDTTPQADDDDTTPDDDDSSVGDDDDVSADDDDTTPDDDDSTADDDDSADDDDVGDDDDATADPALVLHLSLDGSGADLSGYGNVGVYVGSTTGVADRCGLADHARLFDGSSGYVEVADSASLSFSSELTIAAWLRRTDLSSPDTIINKGGNSFEGPEATLALERPQFDGRLALAYSTGWQAAGPGVLDILAWHHVALVAVDGTAEPAFYVDGAQVAISATSSPLEPVTLVPGADPLLVGAEIGSVNSWFGNLELGDLRVWDRALSSLEITTLASEGCN